MKQSKFMTFGSRDAVNGLIMAILGACYAILLPAATQWLSSDTWAIDIDVMALVKGIISMGVLPYLTKNFFTKGDAIPVADLSTNWEAEIAACMNLDELGALFELPLEYYDVWLARYYELGYNDPAPTHDEIRAGSVGTSGPKK